MKLWNVGILVAENPKHEIRNKAVSFQDLKQIQMIKIRIFQTIIDCIVYISGRVLNIGSFEFRTTKIHANTWMTFNYQLM